MIPAERWELAVCASTDPDMWFPEPGQDVRRAKQLCRTCPIITECLAEAKRTHVTYGIWGGQNFSRQAARRQRTAPAAYHSTTTQPPRQSRADYQRSAAQRLELLQQGMNDQEIADTLGITPKAVRGWRNKYRLPAGRGRP